VGFSLRQQGILRFSVAGFSPAGEKPATIKDGNYRSAEG
jgi:hypothetical protein